LLKNDAYRALSDLITKGFMSMHMDLKGVPIVFKTVNENEFELIQLYVGSKEDLFKFNTFFMAFSVLMVDGENILPDRDKTLKILYDFFYDLPTSVYGKVMDELSALKDDMFEASKYLEGFCYTDYSRVLWRMRRNSPNREEFTGIKGTENLSINVCQSNWMLINQTLDHEEEHDNQFSLALLIASASNPKGVKSVKAKYDLSVQTAVKKRKKLAMEGSSPEKVQWTPESWAAPVDTAEELVAELERQMSGKKDKHDLFIEDYIRKIEEDQKLAEEREEERLAVYRQKIKDEGFVLTGDHRALTPEETKEMLENAKNRHNNLVILPSDNIASSDDRSRYYKKIGSKILTGK